MDQWRPPSWRTAPFRAKSLRRAEASKAAQSMDIPYSYALWPVACRALPMRIRV